MCIAFLLVSTLVYILGVPFWNFASPVFIQANVAIFPILAIFIDFFFSSERLFCILASCECSKKSVAHALFFFLSSTLFEFWESVTDWSCLLGEIFVVPDTEDRGSSPKCVEHHMTNVQNVRDLSIPFQRMLSGVMHSFRLLVILDAMLSK